MISEKEIGAKAGRKGRRMGRNSLKRLFKAIAGRGCWVLLFPKRSIFLMEGAPIG